MPRISKSLCRTDRFVVTGLRGGERCGVIVKECVVSFHDDENVLKLMAVMVNILSH